MSLGQTMMPAAVFDHGFMELPENPLSTPFDQLLHDAWDGRLIQFLARVPADPTSADTAPVTFSPPAAVQWFPAFGVGVAPRRATPRSRKTSNTEAGAATVRPTRAHFGGGVRRTQMGVGHLGAVWPEIGAGERHAREPSLRQVSGRPC